MRTDIGYEFKRGMWLAHLQNSSKILAMTHDVIRAHESGCSNDMFLVKTSCWSDPYGEVPYLRVAFNKRYSLCRKIKTFAISLDRLEVVSNVNIPKLISDEYLNFVTKNQTALLDYYNDNITFKQLKGIINKNGG